MSELHLPRVWTGWLVEVVFWLNRWGFSCKVLGYEKEFIGDDYGDDGTDDWESEKGALSIDGLEYKFHTVVLKNNVPAEIIFTGIPGVCRCCDHECMVRCEDPKDASMGWSWRKPDLRWLCKRMGPRVYINADKISLLWDMGEASPLEYPCRDGNGRLVEFSIEGVGEVHSHAVLNHLFPHVQKLKLAREMRREVMVKRIQRAWFKVAFNPHTPVGRRRLHHEALAMTTLVTALANLGEGEWSEC